MQKQQQPKNKNMNGGTRPKNKTKRKRRAQKNGRGAFGDQKISAPTTVGILDTKLTQGLKFDRAAAHDDFPEGGCRIVGDLPNTNDDSIGASASALATTLFAATAGTPGGAIAYGMSPTAYVGTSGWPARNMFGNTSPIPQIAQFFSKFRFREVALVYESTCSTAQTGSVQFCYDLDSASMSNRLATTSQQSFVATNRGARFPAWSPRVVVPLLEARRSSGGDLLYGVTAANTIYGSTINGTFNTMFQGAVSAYTDLAGGNVLLGRYRWRFVLDLYGFRNYSGDGNIAGTPPSQELKEEKASAEPDSPVLVHPLSAKSRHFDDTLRERKDEASSQPRAASKK